MQRQLIRPTFAAAHTILFKLHHNLARINIPPALIANNTIPPFPFRANFFLAAKRIIIGGQKAHTLNLAFADNKNIPATMRTMRCRFIHNSPIIADTRQNNTRYSGFFSRELKDTNLSPVKIAPSYSAFGVVGMYFVVKNKAKARLRVCAFCPPMIIRFAARKKFARKGKGGIVLFAISAGGILIRARLWCNLKRIVCAAAKVGRINCRCTRNYLWCPGLGFLLWSGRFWSGAGDNLRMHIPFGPASSG